MATDYHIYIHGSTGGESNGDSTKPFSVKKDNGFISNQDNIASSNEKVTETGSAALNQMPSWVAIAVAAIKVTDKVLTTGFAHLREYAGHYEYELGYNNFKTTINHVMNPVGYIKQAVHRDFQFRKENQRIEQEARIIGKTIYSDTKIGV